MMKFWLSILLICASVTYTEAQINYVHNGSLEDHWRCPYSADQIKFANYWTAIDSTDHPADYDTFGSPNCTPEYSNVCDAGGKQAYRLVLHFTIMPELEMVWRVFLCITMNLTLLLPTKEIICKED